MFVATTTSVTPASSVGAASTGILALTDYRQWQSEYEPMALLTFHIQVAADGSRRYLRCGKSAPTAVGGYALSSDRATPVAIDMALPAELLESLPPLRPANDACKVRGHPFPIPLGFERRRHARNLGQDFVPEGHARIAQRFNVGNQPRGTISPEGTADRCGRFSRPSGTCAPRTGTPNVETLGYCQTSLRDGDDILAALDKNVRAPTTLLTTPEKHKLENA